ncbi:MAG: SDR family NAD(P)-dependent oxidoreductase [Opitutales bacterium]
MQQRILVTGANRGIGLAFVAHYLAEGARVWACCRQPQGAEALQALQAKAENAGRLSIVALSVGEEASVKACRETVGAETDALDLLINNAGTFAPDGDGLMKQCGEALADVFATNTIGPVIVTRSFADLLAKGTAPRTFSLTSGAGRLGKALPAAGAQYAYPSSKAALQLMIVRMAADLKAAGIIVCGMGPGFVRTDMTAGVDPPPPLTPAQSVASMARVAAAWTPEHTGTFWTWDGQAQVP